MTSRFSGAFLSKIRTKKLYDFAFLCVLGGLILFPAQRGWARGNTPEERLFSHLCELFDPQRIELVLDAPIPANGEVRRMYLHVEGASFSGFRIDDVEADLTFLQLPPVVSWGADEEGLVLEEALGVHFNARILEEDINSFLLDKTLDLEKSEWRDVHCDLSPRGLSATARADLMLNGNVRAKVVLEGTLRLREGNMLFLEDTVFSVNGGEKEIGAVEDALREMQPLVDFRDMPFPVRIHTLDLQEGSMAFSTRVPPSSFTGLRFYQER